MLQAVVNPFVRVRGNDNAGCRSKSPLLVLVASTSERPKGPGTTQLVCSFCQTSPSQQLWIQIKNWPKNVLTHCKKVRSKPVSNIEGKSSFLVSGHVCTLDQLQENTARNGKTPRYFQTTMPCWRTQLQSLLLPSLGCLLSIMVHLRIPTQTLRSVRYCRFHDFGKSQLVF